jgi:preprotein translocase subunit SecD
VSRGVTLIAKRLRWSLLVCVFASTTLAAASAQSIAIEVTDAQAAYDQQTGKPLVAFAMSAASTRAFFELTRKNIGRPVAVIVDGQVVSKPVIQTPIIGGQLQIWGDFDVERARSMARRLSDGTSKLTIEVISDAASAK